jgi:hypothetical protein
MSNRTQQLKKAMQSWWVRAERARFEYGVLGRTNADGSVTVEADRQDYVYVTLDTGTLTIAYNGGNGAVDSRAGLPVRVRDDIGKKIIDGMNTGGFSSGDGNAPSKVYSVNDIEPDSHGNVALDTDDIDEGSTNLYFTDERAQDAIGTILTDSSTIDFTYTDATPAVTAIVIDDSITFAKMQNIATDSLIGRDTASTGDPENITLNATLSMDGSGHLQRAALTGDVTASAGSNATSIASNAVTTAKIADANVTLAKLANIATDSLIGRDTASSGVPENILLNTTLSMDGSGNLQRAALTGDVTASAGSNATTIANNAVTNAKLAQHPAMTVLANNVAITANIIDLSATGGTDAVLRESGSNIGWGTIATGALGDGIVTTAKIADAQITLAKMANLAQSTIIGRAAGAGTGVPTALSVAQVVAIINSTLDHGGLAGLSDDDHAQYLLLAGRSGGQTVTGLTGTGNALLVTRNQALANTDSPVLAATQTNTGDDQAALYVKQLAASFTIPTARFVHQGTGSMLVQLENYSGNASGNAGFAGMRARGTEASPTIVNASDVLGFITYQGYDGSAFQAAAAITITVDGTPGAGDMPGRIDFSTTPDGASTASQAIRINSSQQTLVGGITSMGGGGYLATQAGTSANDAAVGGVLYVDSATRANTTTGETDLASYSVPANTLAVNNQSLEFHAWGTYVNNANSKALKVYFGASSWTVLNTAGSGPTWSVRGRIVRTGASTQDVIIDLISTVGGVVVTVSTAAETLSGAVVLKLTGTGGATNDIKQEGFMVWWHDANS